MSARTERESTADNVVLVLTHREMSIENAISNGNSISANNPELLSTVRVREREKKDRVEENDVSCTEPLSSETALDQFERHDRVRYGEGNLR